MTITFLSNVLCVALSSHCLLLIFLNQPLVPCAVDVVALFRFIFVLARLIFSRLLINHLRISCSPDRGLVVNFWVGEVSYCEHFSDPGVIFVNRRGAWRI